MNPQVKAIRPTRGHGWPRHDVAPPQRGEVWWAYLDPTVGREQAGRRPVIIVSADRYHETNAGLVIVVPTTTVQRPFRSRVPIDPPDGGLTKPSNALCEQLRSISIERLRRRIGSVSARTLAALDDRLRILLDL